MNTTKNEWQRTGSRVYSKGQGHSYNCINIATAKQLHNILTNYEKNTQLNKKIQEQYNKLNKQIIQIQLSLGILSEDINKLKEVIENE